MDNFCLAISKAASKAVLCVFSYKKESLRQGQSEKTRKEIKKHYYRNGKLNCHLTEILEGDVWRQGVEEGNGEGEVRFN